MEDLYKYKATLRVGFEQMVIESPNPEPTSDGIEILQNYLEMVGRGDSEELAPMVIRRKTN